MEYIGSDYVLYISNCWEGYPPVLRKEKEVIIRIHDLYHSHVDHNTFIKIINTTSSLLHPEVLQVAQGSETAISVNILSRPLDHYEGKRMQKKQLLYRGDLLYCYVTSNNKSYSENGIINLDMSFTFKIKGVDIGKGRLQIFPSNTYLFGFQKTI